MKTQSFSISKSQAVEIAKKVFKKLELKIKHEDVAAGKFKLSKSTSFLSWGNDIEFKIVSQSPRKVTITVESSSVMPEIGWGVNEDNETAILNSIKTMVATK